MARFTSSGSMGFLRKYGQVLVSTDGGDSFTQATNAATGIVNAGVFLPFTGGFPHFPGATFRVVTAPTACVFGTTLTVAWEDFRDGVGRIFFAQSPDGGNTWSTGPNGRAMLSDPIPANMQHFFPQLITDPAGVIGCAFYEFGPKPTDNLIDVMMAESYDGGASSNFFTVTDQPWNPTLDAPFSHGSSAVTFIGDYFGMDASGEGFYPLWTDTRTGIQELGTAIVPERSCALIIERSTLGQDEIDARRGTVAGPVVADAFRVVVDGFSAAQIGVTGPGSTLNVASPVTGMNIICTGNTSDTGNYGPEVQRFTFHYNIDFGATDTAFSFGGATLLATLHVAVSTVSAAAEIELIKQPDPFILHGDPAWLSVDLRVFHVRAGDSKFGVPWVQMAALRQRLSGRQLPISQPARARPARTIWRLADRRGCVVPFRVSAGQQRRQRVQLRDCEGALHRPDRSARCARLLPPVPGAEH